MAVLQLQDLTGNIEVLLFSKTYDKFSSLLAEDKIVLVSGKISIRSDAYGGAGDTEEEENYETASIICSDIQEITSPDMKVERPTYKKNMSNEKKLVVTVTDNDSANLPRCIEILTKNVGASPVFFCFSDKGKVARFNANNVLISNSLIQELSSVLGDFKVQVK